MADTGVLIAGAAPIGLDAARGHMDVYLIAAPSAEVDSTVLPLVRDSGNDFARMYSATGPSVYIVRPDGYLGFASSPINADEVVAHLSSTFA
jgi:hypothetical protein